MKQSTRQAILRAQQGHKIKAHKPQKISVQHLNLERSESIAVHQAYDRKWQEALRAVSHQPNEHVRMDAAIKFGTMEDKLKGIVL